MNFTPKMWNTVGLREKKQRRIRGDFELVRMSDGVVIAKADNRATLLPWLAARAGEGYEIRRAR